MRNNKKLVYNVARVLKVAKDPDTSHLWTSQMLAYYLKLSGLKLDGYRFSKLAGYDFDITK